MKRYYFVFTIIVMLLLASYIVYLNFNNTRLLRKIEDVKTVSDKPLLPPKIKLAPPVRKKKRVGKNGPVQMTEEEKVHVTIPHKAFVEIEERNLGTYEANGVIQNFRMINDSKHGPELEVTLTPSSERPPTIPLTHGGRCLPMGAIVVTVLRNGQEILGPDFIQNHYSMSTQEHPLDKEIVLYSHVRHAFNRHTWRKEVKDGDILSVVYRPQSVFRGRDNIHYSQGEEEFLFPLSRVSE